MTAGRFDATREVVMVGGVIVALSVVVVAILAVEFAPLVPCGCGVQPPAFAIGLDPLAPPTFNLTSANGPLVFQNETYHYEAGGYSGNGTATDVLMFSVVRLDAINTTVGVPLSFEQVDVNPLLSLHNAPPLFPLFYVSWIVMGAPTPFDATVGSTVMVEVPAFGSVEVLLYLTVNPVYQNSPLLSYWHGDVSGPNVPQGSIIDVEAGFQ